MDLILLGDDTFFRRLILGFVAASLIAIAARRAHALTRGGAITAVLVGTVGVAAGWSWGALLIAFFTSSTLLSRFRRDEKARRTVGILAKDDERDAVQVLANGAVFAAAAALYHQATWLSRPGSVDSIVMWSENWTVLGGGAIAAACADTWSTELGTLARDAPRLITSGRPVPPGTSGGVTLVGLAATAAGAAFVGSIAALVGWSPRIAIVAALGGIVGALADSFIGAIAQSRRRCPRCEARTERAVHDCGSVTEAAGGLAWLDNDGVNALCTVAGALAAFALWRALN